MLNEKEFRAKQFLPFKALKGYDEAISIIENIKVQKKNLLDEYKEDLNNKILSLKKGDEIKIKYYNNFDYIETTGLIKNISLNQKYIYILNSKISFDDIIDIIN